MKKSLYKIDNDYLELMQEIESMDGEITEDAEKRLIINKHELQTKSIAYLQLIRTKEGMNLMISEEIKRLQALKKRNDNIVARLNNNLLNAVKIHGEFGTPLNKFGSRKSTSVEVEDVNSLPKEFKIIKETEQADKKKIKEALKNGEKIKGCSIKENINLKIN